MRQWLTLTAVVLATALLSAESQQGQQIPPPTAPPPIAPKTTPVGTSKPVGPRLPGVPVRSEAAVIVGQVVDDAGRGVPKAAVRLIADAIVETVLTDERGRFVFRTIPPGEAIVTVQKFGYVDGAFGKRRANGLPLQFSLVTGQAIVDMKIELFRGAVITGMVTDEGSEAIVGARVVAMRRQFAAGEWQFVEAGSDTTDDSGRYRIFGLQPGQYVVSVPTTVFSAPVDEADVVAVGARWQLSVDAAVSVKTGGTAEEQRHAVIAPGPQPPRDDGREGVYPTQYYPNAEHRLLAAPLDISSAEVRYALDFHLRLVPAHKVSGRLFGPGLAAIHRRVRLVPIGTDSMSRAETATTVSAGDGTFTFVRVPQGRYRLEAGGEFDAGTVGGRQVLRAPNIADSTDIFFNPNARFFWARTNVDVDDEDVTIPDLMLREPASVTGTATFERDPSARSAVAATFLIRITPAEPGLSHPDPLSAPPNAQFQLNDLIPGSYFVGVSAVPPGWYLKSITVDGDSALDGAVEIREDSEVAVVLTTRRTEIIGSVSNARMEKVAGATVIIMPVTAAGAAAWTPNRTRETRASAGGVFIVHGLPPGDYLIVAIDDAVAEGWQDPSVVATLRLMATRINIKDAESKIVQLRLSTLKR